MDYLWERSSMPGFAQIMPSEQKSGRVEQKEILGLVED